MGQNPNPASQARVEGEPPSYQPQPPPPPGYAPPPPPSYQGYPEPTRRWDQSQIPPQPQPLPPMGPQPWMRDRRPHRTPVLGPTLLIGAGLVFLLINLGVLDESVWSQLLQLWPLLLIAIGLDLLLGRRNPALSLLIVLLVLGG